MEILIGIIVFWLGACIGSFINVLAIRMPKGEKANGRSSCPQCRHVLAAHDLIPIFSYIFSLGRCRYCRKPISSRYLIVELTLGALFLSAYLVLGPASILEYFNFGRVLFAVSVFALVFMIDLKHYLILDRVILPAGIVLFLWGIALSIFDKSISIFSPAFLGTLAGLVAFALVWSLWKFSQGKWIGLGDGKLLLLIGIACGALGLLVAFFIALISGTAVAIVYLATGRKTMESPLPFGTFLAAGAYLALLFGTNIGQWYLHLLGLY